MRAFIYRFTLVGLLCIAACAATMSEEKPEQNILEVCPTAHEIERIESIETLRFSGVVYIDYGEEGDVHPLPETLVHLAAIRNEDSEASEFSEQTGEDGFFSLEYVPDGRYHLTVCKAGFVTLIGTVAVSREADERSMTLTTRLDW
jgi:hypothetical protein